MSKPNRPFTFHWSKILIYDPFMKHRQKPDRLRRAMLEYGFVRLCAICDQKPTWFGCELTIHVHHINGNWRDNRPDNVQFACPNCHDVITVMDRKGIKGPPD